MASAMERRVVALRRDLHRRPELSWQEVETARRICAELDELGIRYRSGVASTGVVADLPGPDDGPTIALRADMDALPIRETSGEPFASETDGVMHACGHDAHAAMVVGAAALLVDDPPPCRVRLLFQPAEELGEGAKAMIEAGALDGVDRIFGAHVDLHYPVGIVVAAEGPLAASTDEVELRLEGRQAHAARPHEGADALVAGAALVGEIQRFLAREVDPGEPAVITIGQMEAGVASNVVAGRARLRGTVRAQSTAMRSRLLEGLERLAAAVGAAHGVGIDCHVESGTPAIVNDAAAAVLMRHAAAEVVGESGVRPLRRPNLAGEDFAFYLERTAGGFVRLGAQPRDWDGSGAHSGGFRIDEGVLAIGARYFHRLVHLACGG